MKSTVERAEPSPAIVKPESLGKYHFAQAGAMLARGKLSDAILQYVKAPDINPNWPEALCNKGIALTRLGGEQSLKTALTCFERALAIDPDFALAHNNRGATTREIESH
jgi:tetratricopeptide (TPR) repeat protein